MPGTASFFWSAWLGRAGIAMTGLSLVWLVYEARGSFAAAGAATGVFAAAEALVGPQVARLVDRHGQTRITPVQSVVHATVVGLLCATAFSSASIGWVFVLAAAAGASIPQFGALSAARWAFVLREQPKPWLTAAFALEAVANSIAFMIGPVVVSALGAQHLSVLSQSGAGGLILLSGALLIPQRSTDPGSQEKPAPGTARGQRSWSAAMVMIIAMNFAVGVFFGSNQVSVTGFTVSMGNPGAAAPVFLAASCAGLLSASLYGRIAADRPARLRLVRAATALAVVSLSLLFVPSVAWLIPAIVLCELFVPPVLVNLNVLMEEAAPRAVLTQAFTWANSASAAGMAVAASAAGFLLDGWGPSGGFYVLILATLILAGLSPLVRGGTRGSSQDIMQKL